MAALRFYFYTLNGVELDHPLQGCQMTATNSDLTPRFLDEEHAGRLGFHEVAGGKYPRYFRTDPKRGRVTIKPDIHTGQRSKAGFTDKRITTDDFDGKPVLVKFWSAPAMGEERPGTEWFVLAPPEWLKNVDA